MRRTFISAVLLLLALLYALYGQARLPDPETTQTGILYLATAVALLLVGLSFDPSTGDSPDLKWERPETTFVPLLTLSWYTHAILISLSFWCAVVAFVNLAHNQFTSTGTLAWLAAIAFFLLAFAERPKTDKFASKQVTGNKSSASLIINHSQLTIDNFSLRHFVLLLAIFLLAAFFRFYHLPDLPLDTWSDQAEKLLDIHDVLNGYYPIFFTRNTGREAFQFYWTAVLIWLTPLDFGYLALKVGTALIGLLTTPFVYLLARELYGRNIALLTAALFAVSHWHVAITRVGLRFPLTAAFVSPILYFLFRAFKYNHRNDWLACGLFLGVGLHTYIPMRIVPVLLVVLVFLKTALDTWYMFRLRRAPGNTFHISRFTFHEASSLSPAFWKNAILGGITSALVFLPLARYSYDEPEMFWYRAATRTGAVEISAETWHTLWDNIKNALLMFNYKGDVVVTNTIPFSPQLDMVTGALFILGLVYLLWRLIAFHDRRALYVVVSGFVMLLPSILSIAFPRENPSVVRTGGAIPIVMLISALPLWLIVSRISNLQSLNLQISKWLAGIVTAVLLAAIILLNYHWYFIQYEAHYRRTVWNTVEMGQVIHEFVQNGGDLTHAYHIPYPYWADTRLIGLNVGDITWNNAMTNLDYAWFQIQDPASKLFLLHVDDEHNLLRLQAFFPNGQGRRYYSAVPDGKDFVVFYVPARESEQ